MRRGSSTQGNFGSVDGDPAAAMRYTECRLAKPAMSLWRHQPGHGRFQANYDGNEHEPVVLPARFQSAGQRRRRYCDRMATNIPPHNLGEVVAACVAD